MDATMPYVRGKQKYQVRIPASVREEINLHEGDTLEARIEDGHIVLIPQQMIARETGRKPADKKDQSSLASYIGAAKGLYSSPQDVDDYIRNLREEWQD